MTDLRDLIPNPTAAELALVARYGAVPEDPRRERAFSAFAATGLPHRRMEAWKWTDVKQALSELTAPSAGAQPDPFDGLEGPVVRFGPHGLARPGGLPAGLELFEKNEAKAVGGAEDLPFGALTGALADAPAALLIEVSEPVDIPLRLVFEGAGETAFARVAVIVRPGAAIHLVESHLGGAGLSSTFIEFGLQDGARASRTLHQAGGADEVAVITASATLGEGAAFTQTALALGAKLARIETRLVHQGEGAEARLNAAYLLSAGRHADFTSHVRHGAPGCVTRQTTKGAVRAGGRGVFQGKFHVPRIGQKSDAEMQHHALLLDEGAEVNAKPELEIYADDVACAHGNTAGALDADALFYMRQRGLPEAEATALLTEAFIAEALEDADVEAAALQGAARAWLRA